MLFLQKSSITALICILLQPANSIQKENLKAEIKQLSRVQSVQASVFDVGSSAIKSLARRFLVEDHANSVWELNNQLDDPSTIPAGVDGTIGLSNGTDEKLRYPFSDSFTDDGTSIAELDGAMGSVGTPSVVPSTIPSVAPTVAPTRPTAPPSSAPTYLPGSPTPCPSATPTTRPTPVPTTAPTALIRATGFVSEYSYATSSCSGIPYSIASVSLGICFTCPFHLGYCSYSLNRSSVQYRPAEIVLSFYNDSACSNSSQLFLFFRLNQTCFNGYSYNYSTNVPAVPASVSTSYYSTSASAFCGFGVFYAYLTIYRTIGSCNPSTNQIYTCSGYANYKVTTYESPSCAGPVIASSTPALLSCSYQFTSTYLDLPYGNFSIKPFYAYVSNECTSGPTASPTSAPSAPTPQPISMPTIAPTYGPTPSPTRTRYFVSQYVYDTSICSGVPNTVTVYQLGICFNYDFGYGLYSKGTTSPKGYITLIFSRYSSGNSCVGTPSSSTTYNVATSCSNGSNYTVSATAPVVPQSIATSYYSYGTSCTTSFNFVAVYQTVSNCNPSTNQIYTCSAPNYYIQSYSDASCSGTPIAKTQYSLAACSTSVYGTLPVQVLFPVAGNIYYGYMSQCTAGPTAFPTLAPSTPTVRPTAGPSNPSFQPTALPTIPSMPSCKPTARPTLSPTPVPRATGYVSQYSYSTSTCSGAPNSVTAYSLGICFFEKMYDAFVLYTVGSQSNGAIDFIVTFYSDDLCTLANPYNPAQSFILPTTCSGGSNYTHSSSTPMVPQSIATSYYSQSSLCGLGPSSALVSIYQIVGTCNPSSQIYTCSGTSYSVITFVSSGCTGSSTTSSYAFTTCVYASSATNMPSFIAFNQAAYVSTQGVNQPSNPTPTPTSLPTGAPGSPTSAPSPSPTIVPSAFPTRLPSSVPTPSPTTPTAAPTSSPTYLPGSPTNPPTAKPTNTPTLTPLPEPTNSPILPPVSITHNPTITPSSVPAIPTLMTNAPTVSTVDFSVAQVFSGISLSQYEANPSGNANTIVQTVAASISINSAYVSVISVVTSSSSRRRLSSDSAISVNYIVFGPAAGYSSSAAAYTALSTALTTSVANGSFQQSLVNIGTVNQCTALAASTAQTPVTVNVLGAPSLAPSLPVGISSSGGGSTAAGTSNGPALALAVTAFAIVILMCIALVVTFVFRDKLLTMAQPSGQQNLGADFGMSPIHNGAAGRAGADVEMSFTQSNPGGRL